MLVKRPTYFEDVRSKSSKRWDQLEQDPELAGPWHQLFKQVQSPRHVLSELLQNADDAGATEATVKIVSGVFTFEHNGEDFSEEHFASLCRFGYSSKRSLHTIGFRGIGFKSTFSLGDTVELFSPTLSVGFNRRRFTEPSWASSGVRTDGKTCIRVAICDEHRQHEIERNLEEWLSSPVSLLFFRSLRRIQINDKRIHWASFGPGPVPNTEWMGMYGNEDKPVLIVRSGAEPFPEAALAEIRDERTLSAEEEAEFPASKIELVLGVEGRLFVVLPTGVKTELPFACNAPFIAKPDRNDIKDPSISPTNRWLLERAGRLAASAMLAWLSVKSAKVVERAPAYGLLPDVDREDSSLGGICGTIVEETFADAIDDKNVLLTDAGEVVLANQSVIVPERVLDIWSAAQATEFLDDGRRPVLSQHIFYSDRDKLKRWNLVEEIDKKSLLKTLEERHLPKPESWRKLMLLWDYIAPQVTGYFYYNAEKIRIAPVQGQDVLYSSSEVVRLGEKKLLQSDDDWSFLSEHLTVLNQNWTRFLADQRRQSTDSDDHEVKKVVESAYAVLKKSGLDETSNVDAVINRVAAGFYAQDEVALADCIRLAQIAAKLGASSGDEFKFATRDSTLRPVGDEIFYDEDGGLEELIPNSLRETCLLHGDYVTQFSSCTHEEWLKWISQGNSGLKTFIPFSQTRRIIYGRSSVEQEARKRGNVESPSFPYVTSSFVVEDWDFHENYWRHWRDLAKGDPRIWGRIAERVVLQRENYWTPARSARLKQIATTGSERSIINGHVLPGWAMRLRELACLPDTHRVYRKPNELMRRTPETESLIDIEPFVHALLDRESSRPILDLLGVRNLPLSPAALLDRLRVYSKAESTHVAEVEKCYRRLDQMISSCSTAHFLLIKSAFNRECLVLSQDGAWVTADSVFLISDEEDVPGAAIVRAAVSDLSLWTRVGVQQRPTADLAIQWLQELPSNKQLSAEDSRRVRALLARYPHRIWDECEHWLNLAAEWVPTGQLKYALSMQSLVPWSHLHPWVKQQTADMQKLSAATVSEAPFSALPTLAGKIDEQFHVASTRAERAVQKEWIIALGLGLRRVQLSSDEETERVRLLADRLAKTVWQVSPGLETIPYINGVPAGLPRRAEVLWLGNILHVGEAPKAKLAKRVPEEIARHFSRDDIKAALDYSFERSAGDVSEYLEENFQLSAQGALDLDALPAKVDAPAATEEVGVPQELPAAQDPAIATDVPADQEPSDHAVEDEVIEPDHYQDEPETVVTHSAPKPKRPDIMERFAKSKGYKKDSEDRYFHGNGGWISRAQDSRFPWESRNASGELERYYWPKDHCLERDALQLEADVWSLIDQMPGTYALVLSDVEGSPIEVTGARLRVLLERGGLSLHPATYRIVYNHDHK